MPTPKLRKRLREAAKSLSLELARRGVGPFSIGHHDWYKTPALLVGLTYPRRDYERLPKEWEGFPVACSLGMYEDTFSAEEIARNNRYYDPNYVEAV